MEGLTTVKVNLRERKGRVCCSGRSGFNPFWCWTDSPVQTEAGGSLGCSLEAHGWISRLQTDTECWFTEGRKRNGFICNSCLSAVLCKVFRQNTKLHLSAHVKEGTQLPKWGEKKSSITAGSYYEPDTRAPVNTFLSLREAVISLFIRLFPATWMDLRSKKTQPQLCLHSFQPDLAAWRGLLGNDLDKAFGVLMGI